MTILENYRTIDTEKRIEPMNIYEAGYLLGVDSGDVRQWQEEGILLRKTGVAEREPMFLVVDAVE